MLKIKTVQIGYFVWFPMEMKFTQSVYICEYVWLCLCMRVYQIHFPVTSLLVTKLQPDSTKQSGKLNWAKLPGLVVDLILQYHHKKVRAVLLLQPSRGIRELILEKDYKCFCQVKTSYTEYMPYQTSKNLTIGSWWDRLYHLCLGNYLIQHFSYLMSYFLWHLMYSAYSLLSIFSAA